MEEKPTAIKPSRLTDEIKRQRIIGNINKLFDYPVLLVHSLGFLPDKQKLLERVKTAKDDELLIMYDKFGKPKRSYVIMDLTDFAYNPDKFITNQKRTSESTRTMMLSRIAQYERSPCYSPESKRILTNLKEKIEKEPYFRPKCLDDVNEFFSSIINSTLKDKKEDMIKEKAREVAEQKAAKKAKSYFEGISKKKEFFKHMKRV